MQPTWSTPRRDGCTKPVLSMHSQHGGLCGNCYSSPGVLENSLSIHSMKTGEEEQRERPIAQKPGVHLSTLHVARGTQGFPCCWFPLQNAGVLETSTKQGPAVGMGLRSCTRLIFATSTDHSCIFAALPIEQLEDKCRGASSPPGTGEPGQTHALKLG